MIAKTGRIYANKTLELWGHIRTKVYYAEWFTQGINKTCWGSVSNNKAKHLDFNATKLHMQKELYI